MEIGFYLRDTTQELETCHDQVSQICFIRSTSFSYSPSNPGHEAWLTLPGKGWILTRMLHSWEREQNRGLLRLSTF